MVRACNENGKWKNTSNGALYIAKCTGEDRRRPTETWMDNIMEDIKAQGMDIREAKDKARERSTSRLLVRASSSADA